MWKSLKTSLIVACRISLRSSFTRSNHILLIAAMILTVSLSSMLITVSLVRGFKEVVEEKLCYIWGNYRVLPSSMANETLEEYYGQERNRELEKTLRSLHIKYDIFQSIFALSHTKKGIEGVMLKSFSDPDRWDRFMIKKSTLPLDSMDYGVYISNDFSKKYGLKIGSVFAIYLFDRRDVLNNAIRARKLTVAGIYHTGIAEHDGKTLLCAPRLMSKLKYEGIGGYELFLDRNTPKESEKRLQAFFLNMPLEWTALPIQRILPELFDWIEYAASTEWIFFSILSVLILINLIIGFMLFTIVRSRMIGALITLGYGKRMIYYICFISGLLWSFIGIAAGIALSAAFLYGQRAYGWIKLDEKTHYLSQAIVYVDWRDWALILSLMWMISILSLIIPARIAASYSPIKVLRFS